MNKKLKRVLTVYVPVGVAAYAAGYFGTKLISGKQPPRWDVVRVTPEHLQAMLDAPETIIAFETACVMVGNTTSSEA